MLRSIWIIQNSGGEPTNLVRNLTSQGYSVRTVVYNDVADGRLQHADADLALLEANPSELTVWCHEIRFQPPMPLVWWCEWDGSLAEAALHDALIDGIVSPGMSPAEMQYAFQLSAAHFRRRTQWTLERERLLARLDEHKVVERAKSILCEIKHISEAEAYAFLRRQAMSERKRLTDIAASIVQVYQLLRD